MRLLQLGKHKVELYDSIEDLPMMRFHKYNKMLLVDAGIGSDLNDFDRHIEKALIYARSKTPELAAAELDNLRQNVYFIQSGLSPRCLAFAVLIKSIDGKEQTDISEENLQKLVSKFGNLPIKDITSTLAEVKKKIDDELTMYFPQLFDDATVKEYYDELKQRTLAILDIIIGGETAEGLRLVQRLTEELLTYSKPQQFSGSDNAEIAYDKQFERMCLVLAQHLNVDAKKYTVLEFYNAFEYLKEVIKQRQKQAQRLR